MNPIPPAQSKQSIVTLATTVKQDTRIHRQVNQKRKLNNHNILLQYDFNKFTLSSV